MKKFVSLLALLIVISSASFAEKNAEVKSRPLPEEMEKQIMQNRSNEEQSEESHSCDKQIQTGAYADQYPPIIHYSYSRHSLDAILALDDGYSIVLEDGSIWTLSANNYNEIMSWMESDPLFVYPNDSWFSNHKYKIFNQELNTYVPVTMTHGPTIGGTRTLQVVAIDDLKGEVYLNDNSRWIISSSDKYILSKWFIGDYVFVGSNNGWLCSLKNILINVNMYNHIRAQQF